MRRGLWESDVRSYKPTTAVVMLGMNDASNSIFNDASSSQELEEKVNEEFSGSKIIMQRSLIDLKFFRLSRLD